MKKLLILGMLLWGFSLYSTPAHSDTLPSKSITAVTTVEHAAAVAPSPDDLQATLKQALRAWKKVGKKIKITQVSASQEGGQPVLSGQAKLFRQAVTFEATFASATAVEHMTVRFGPDVKLKKGYLKDFSRTDLRKWMPSGLEPLVRADRIEIRFAEQNQVAEATLVMKARGWKPMDFGALTADDVELAFAVQNPAAKRPSVSASLSGGLAVGTARATLTGTVSSEKEHWVFGGTVEGVRLQPLMTALGSALGGGFPVPADVFDVAIEAASFTMNPGARTFEARGTSSLGQAVIRFAPATPPSQKKSKKKRKQAAPIEFMAGFAPPASFAFADVLPALGILDEMELANTAIVLSSKPQTADLDLFSALGHSPTVGRGMTLLGGYRVDKLAPELTQLIGQSQLVLRATVSDRPADLEMVAELDTDIAFDAARNVVMQGVDVTIRPRPSAFEVSLGGDMAIRAGHETLLFKADVGVDVTSLELNVSGQLDGTWSNPFGLAEGLHVRDLGLGFGVSFRTTPIPLPSMAMEGTLLAGDLNSPAFSGDVTVGLDAANPINTMIDAGFSRLSINDIVKAFCTREIYTSIPQEMRNTILKTRLENVRLTVVAAPEGVRLFDEVYDPGFLVRADATLAGYRAAFLAGIDYRDGLAFQTAVDPLVYEPVFALRGARGEPRPSIHLVLKRSTRPKLAINGSVQVLGLHSETDLLITDSGFEIHLSGQIFDAFRANLMVHGTDFRSGGSFRVAAEMQDDLFRYITENTARELDQATQRTQTDLIAAQNEITRLQHDLRGLDPVINEQRRIVQGERDRDLARVRAAEQEVARAQQQVAARDGEIENNKAIVRQERERDFRQAEQEVARAQQHVTAMDRKIANQKTIVHQERERNLGPLRTAERDVHNWRQEVNRLQTRIKQLEREIAKEPWRVDKAGDLAATAIAKETANGSLAAAQEVLRAVQRTIKDIPVEADPRVVSAITARETANAALHAARQTLAGVRQAVQRTPVEMDPRVAGAITARGTATAALEVARQALAGVQHLANQSPIDLDPRIAAPLATQQALHVELEAVKQVLELGKGASRGTLQGAKWIVQHGNPMGVVQISTARFEGALNAVDGGQVTLHLKGTYAGQPLNTSVGFNFHSPLQAVEALVAQLTR